MIDEDLFYGIHEVSDTPERSISGLTAATKTQFESVTNAIIEAMLKAESFVITGKKGKIKEDFAEHFDFATNKVFKGVNLISIEVFLQEYNYQTPLWINRSDVAKYKGTIKPNAPSVEIIAATKKGEKVVIVEYVNMEEVDGIDYGKKIKPAKPSESSAKAIVDGMPNRPSIGHKFKDTEGYYGEYRRVSDEIYIRPRETFKTWQLYYSTLFHELIHATGHEKRLNRIELKRYDVPINKAKEEMIAQLGCQFLAAKCGIGDALFDYTHNYLKWQGEEFLNEIQDNAKAVLLMAAEAQKAADYILNEYVDSDEPKAKRLKIAQAKATAQAQRIRILQL